MAQRVGYRFLSALISTLALASLAVAQEVMILDGSKVGNGPELEGGTYRLQVIRNRDSTKVLFYKGGDLLAARSATVVKQTKKARHTEIDYLDPDGENIITRIWIEGSKESLIFTHDSPHAN